MNKIVKDKFLNMFLFSFLFLPAAMVVVKIDGPPVLCKTDEIGELCVASEAMGASFWGLKGKSQNTFSVSIDLTLGYNPFNHAQVKSMGSCQRFRYKHSVRVPH